MTVAAQPTHRAPSWLQHVLADAGVAAGSEVVRLAGRNESYRVDGPDCSVVLKRLVGPRRDQRFIRTLAHAGRTWPGPAAPVLRHSDQERRVLVFNTLLDAATGSELLVEQRFGTDLCARIGTALARLHDGPLEAMEELAAPEPSLPSAEALSALPLALVSRFTAGEVQAWRLIQSDPTLAESLRELREGSARAPRTPVHGDLRIDQVLVNEDGPHLVDWEEFGAGDPAYDTGSWIGEWVFRAVLDIPTARGDGLGTGEARGVLHHPALDTAEIVRRGVAKLDALAPHITAFWDAYRRDRLVLAGEAARVTAFAGWHLLDRLLAHAHAASSLPALHRAAAGIGQRILANPPGAAQALGIYTSEPDVGAA